MIELPNIARTEIANHQVSKKPVFLRTPPSQPGACSNCQGLGAVLISFARSGPYDRVPATKDVIVTGPDNKWWIVDTKEYPCPVCGDMDTRRRYFWKNSGLQLPEQEWRVEFFKQHPGKENALEFAHEILSRIPRPTGWYYFFGSYGVGKSGLLKALVAQTILADVPARYVTSAKMLAEIRDTYGSNTEIDEMLVVEQYDRYPLLAIDEIDRASSTDWARSMLFTLINNRYDRRSSLCTLLATNQDPLPPGFEYLESRVQDGIRVLVGGASLRGT